MNQLLSHSVDHALSVKVGHSLSVGENQDCHAQAVSLRGQMILKCSKILTGSLVSIHANDKRFQESGATKLVASESETPEGKEYRNKVIFSCLII